MTQIRAMLEERERELSGQVAECETALGTLRLELEAARRALAALDRAGSSRGPRKSAAQGPCEGSIQDQIIEVMRSQEPGGPLSSASIRSLIVKRFGSAPDRTSLSPQLSRLRAAGRLHLSASGWSLNG